MITKTTYYCPLCNEEYSTEKGALACEKSHYEKCERNYKKYWEATNPVSKNIITRDFTYLFINSNSTGTPYEKCMDYKSFNESNWLDGLKSLAKRMFDTPNVLTGYEKYDKLVVHIKKPSVIDDAYDKNDFDGIRCEALASHDIPFIILDLPIHDLEALRTTLPNPFNKNG